MIGFQQVARYAEPGLIERIRDLAVSRGHVGVFNPSFGTFAGTEVIAYRASPGGGRTIRSYVGRRHRGETSFTVTDLTAIGESEGLNRVADPKVVEGPNALYVTFNTGYARDHDNDIYLIEVAPRLGAPQRVVASFDRQRVEKNWAFFSTGGLLRGIYQLHPYREIELVDGALGAGDELRFALREPAAVSSLPAKGLSIGTQLVQIGDGGHGLIAHEKWSVRGKRSYFGRTVRIDGIGTDNVEIQVNGSRLIHRWQDALPRRTAHNPNLLSATYFSGLVAEGPEILLGYGINDAGFAAARMKEDALWP